MRKLLTLFTLCIVLGMAGVANATVAMDVFVNGQPFIGQDVAPSDIIQVDMRETLVSSFVGWSGNTVNVSAGDAPFSVTSNPDSLVGFLAIAYLIAPDGFGGLDITGGATAAPVPTGRIFTFDFHVPNLDESSIIIIDVVLGNYGNGFLAAPGPGDGHPYEVLHVIPEPLTLSLLALGGLGLIRRRRA